MKKLMVVAAVAMATLGLRAATADWSLDIYMDDQFGSGLADGALALYCGGELVTTVNSDGGGTFTDTISEVAGGSDWTAVLTVGLSDDGGSFTTATKEYAWTMPVFKGGGDPADSSALADVNGALFNAFTDPNAGALPTLADATAQGWTVAPEPTSGLLLLIGVAGLALRRRRA